jgi:hypothetical protein
MVIHGRAYIAAVAGTDWSDSMVCSRITGSCRRHGSSMLIAWRKLGPGNLGSGLPLDCCNRPALCHFPERGTHRG